MDRTSVDRPLRIDGMRDRISRYEFADRFPPEVEGIMRHFDYKLPWNDDVLDVIENIMSEVDPIEFITNIYKVAPELLVSHCSNIHKYKYATHSTEIDRQIYCLDLKTPMTVEMIYKRPKQYQIFRIVPLKECIAADKVYQCYTCVTRVMDTLSPMDRIGEDSGSEVDIINMRTERHW